MVTRARLADDHTIEKPHGPSETTMKLKHAVAALAVAISGAASAMTTDLGVLNATDSSFSREFWRIFNAGSALGNFTDYYTFELAESSTATGGTLVFDWGGVDLSISSVGLAGGTLASAQVDTTPDTFSFSGLGAGNYTLAVNGNLKQIGIAGIAQYSGTIHAVAAAVPEPEHAAMMFAGLLGLGMFGARRARTKA